ncbi:bacteriocin [Litorilituus lipolyticus]|nr:bacteriocin [Litorilituus lipolyticus]
MRELNKNELSLVNGGTDDRAPITKEITLGMDYPSWISTVGEYLDWLYGGTRGQN